MWEFQVGHFEPNLVSRFVLAGGASMAFLLMALVTCSHASSILSILLSTALLLAL